MTSSPISSKLILVFCFSFRAEDSRASLTFVWTCRAWGLSALRAHGACGHPPGQGYLLCPG